MTENNCSPPSRVPIDNIRIAAYTPMAVRAALQLGLFTPLADGPMTAEELARALGVKPRRLALLLYQLVLSDFLNMSGGRFSNTDMTAYYLVKGMPNYIGEIHGVWTEQFNAMMHIADTIHTDTAQTKMDFSAMSEIELEGFLRGLHGSAVAAGRSLSKSPKIALARNLIDIGGGSGGLAIALCEEHPMLKATIVDLPSVVPIATQLVSEAGLTDRINVTTADIIIRPPKGKFDIATARSFFQVLSIEQCKRAAQNISSSLITGGTLFILGMLTDDTRLSPSAAVGMNLVFMNMFDNGQAYTETEYRSWLANAEFIKISRKPHLMGYDLITAEKS